MTFELTLHIREPFSLTRCSSYVVCCDDLGPLRRGARRACTLLITASIHPLTTSYSVHEPARLVSAKPTALYATSPSPIRSCKTSLMNPYRVHVARSFHLDQIRCFYFHPWNRYAYFLADSCIYYPKSSCYLGAHSCSPFCSHFSDTSPHDTLKFYFVSACISTKVTCTMVSPRLWETKIIAASNSRLDNIYASGPIFSDIAAFKPDEGEVSGRSLPRKH